MTNPNLPPDRQDADEEEIELNIDIEEEEYND